MGLLLEPEHALGDGRFGPALGPDLEALALAIRRIAAHTEDRVKVLTARLVRGHDGDGAEVRGNELAWHPASGRLLGGHAWATKVTPTVRFWPLDGI